MQNISIPTDAFSHGQIKSKLWMIERFNAWSELYLPKTSFVLNWYGSWVGIGPFMLLSNTKASIHEVNLYDLDPQSLKTSELLLEQWRYESTRVFVHCRDVNDLPTFAKADYIFINTSCEHMGATTWIENIPAGSFVLLQSTDMPHPEHINPAKDLVSFSESVSGHIEVIDTAELFVKYPDKSFSRFMIFGRKK